MKREYITPDSTVISVESSVLMLSNEGNASFQPGNTDDEYEGDFRSSRFEWDRGSDS